METTKKNISAYVQAGITLLLILCTFLPFFTAKGNGFSISLSHMYSILTFGNVETKYKLYGYLFVMYFMLLVLNVFIQALKSCRLLSCLLSMMGIALLGVTHLSLSKIYDKTHYGVGFYIIIILLVALVLAPAIIEMTGKKTEKKSEETENDENEADETDDETMSKIEELKAKIKELEEQEKE